MNSAAEILVTDLQVLLGFMVSIIFSRVTGKHTGNEGFDTSGGLDGDLNTKVEC